MRTLSLTGALALLFVFATHAGLRADDKKAEDKKADDKPPAAETKHGFLGVRLDAQDDKVIVEGVQPNSPAEKAGMKKDDVIVKVGKTEVKTPQDVQEAVGDLKPGEKVTIVVKRDGKEQTITATLGERPADQD